MRDKISPGRQTPQAANYYLIAMYAPGRAPEVDPYRHTAFVLYAPFLDTLDDCKILIRRGSQWTMESGDVKCKTKDNILMLSVARKATDTTASGEFVVYAATGIIFDDDHGIITDYTGTAAVRVDKAPIDLGNN